MTQPTTIFFGSDGIRRNGEPSGPKVFLRSLLYSTSKRGQMIESMHVTLRRGESSQNFSIWVYGEDRLARGSGLHAIIISSYPKMRLISGFCPASIPLKCLRNGIGIGIPVFLQSLN